MKSSKIDLQKEKFEELFNAGLSDYKIAKELGMNHASVFQYRKKHGYIRDSLKENQPINIAPKEMEIIIGTVLGDATLRRTNKNAFYVVSHSAKQKEYCKFITDELSALGSKFYHSKRITPDERTGKLYESYICRLPANPALNYIYEKFYPNGKKIIPNDIWFSYYFTERALAFLYMDDGNKTTHGYAIATMCFTEEDILEFRKLLFNKFNLETSMFSDHRIYIKAKSAEHFKNIVAPYMHETMMYKL